MDPSQQKQEFSIAYVHSVATVAGFAFDWRRVDQDSVDGQLSARTGAAGTARRPRLEIQLKCTDIHDGVKPTFTYPLKIKNYDDLRATTSIVPHLLIVVGVPKQVNAWLAEPPNEMVLRRCAYWCDLRGKGAHPAKSTVRIPINCSQRFDVASLRTIMQGIDKGTF